MPLCPLRYQRLPVFVRRLAFFAGFLLFGPAGLPQSYYFRHYQVENGLSNNAVVCSMQDKNGFLWFGTKDGLNRFDGYNFKIFRNDPESPSSIGNNFIHSLYEDPGGTIWVGTEGGLYRYDAGAECFTLLPGTGHGPIRDIRMDDNHNLWFILGFTLFRYSARDKSLHYYEISSYFEATSLCIAPGSGLWIATTAGYLEKYEPDSGGFTAYDMFSHSPPAVSRWIEKIQSTPDGTILAGTSTQGAKLFDIKTKQYRELLTYNPDNTGIFVRNFVQTGEKEYWIATETGVFIYNLATGATTNLRKAYNDPYSISDNAVYTFCRDREGGIWAGTYFGGINYHPKQYAYFRKFFPQTGENSLSGNVVREIRQDHSGNLWIGTEDAGLNKLNPSTGRFVHFQPTGKKGSISYSNIHGLLPVGNTLWIGTFEHGLDVLDLGTEKVIRHYDMETAPHVFKSNFIYCIYQAPSGEIMLGTTRGAYNYNREKDNFTLVQGLPGSDWYTSLLKDENGIVWATTYGDGVNFLDTRTGRTGNLRHDPKDKTSLCNNRVNAVFEDSRRQLWFATEGGLCRLDPITGKFKRYTESGFPGNFILSLLEDNDHNLWISTTGGLACFNPQTGRATTFTRINGLLNDQFNFSSAYKDPSGKMYFGSVKGMISFNPAGFLRNSFVPPVYITGFQVYNKDLVIGQKGSPLKRSITQTDKITLPYNQSTISIDFAALSYTAPEKTEYAYKMEGLDKEWTYLKTNRKAYFTRLPAGNYTFKVKASNGNGVWNEKETLLSIRVLPPWWAGPWAFSLYAAAAIALLFYLIRGYHRRSEERNRRRIEQLEIAKEKEIYEAKIEFFTNVAHEIRTPLTLIRGPLEKVMKLSGKPPEVSRNLAIMERNTNRLINLTNQLLDFRQTEIKGFRLNFVKTNVAELLEDTAISFSELAEQKRISFSLASLPHPLYAFLDTEAFTKILTNLFSNAVKYAETRVNIKILPFTEGDKSFTIEVENDGYLVPYELKEKIFEPFFRLRETEKEKGTGIGLALSRSLAELHKGILALRESGNGLNCFFLTLPVHQDIEFNLHARGTGKISATVNND